MCNMWKYPTEVDREIRTEVLSRLPNLTLTIKGRFVEEFFHLNLSQVYDALSFYYDHKEKMDKEIGGLTSAYNSFYYIDK